MGGPDDLLSPTRRERSRREHDLTRVYAVLACLLLLILIQFLLFMVGMEGWLGGKESRIGPTAFASAACFLGSCLLVGALRGRGVS